MPKRIESGLHVLACLGVRIERKRLLIIHLGPGDVAFLLIADCPPRIGLNILRI